jgi:ribosome-binding factor A
MPKDYPRADRVERLARQVLGEAVLDLKDPRLGFVTVTDVRVTSDLRHARVWVSVLGGDEEREASMEAIRHAAPRLRTLLGHEVRLRYTPELEFLEDDTARRGARIEELLRDIGAGAEDGAEPGDAAPAGDDA